MGMSVAAVVLAGDAFGSVAWMFEDKGDFGSFVHPAMIGIDDKAAVLVKN
jgi:hypothetical protein